MEQLKKNQIKLRGIFFKLQQIISEAIYLRLYSTLNSLTSDKFASTKAHVPHSVRQIVCKVNVNTNSAYSKMTHNLPIPHVPLMTFHNSSFHCTVCHSLEI